MHKSKLVYQYPQEIRSVDLLGVHGGELGDQETVGLGNGHLTGGCRKVGLKLQNLLSLLLSKLPKDSNTLSFKF